MNIGPLTPEGRARMQAKARALRVFDAAVACGLIEHGGDKSVRALRRGYDRRHDYPAHESVDEIRARVWRELDT